MKKILSTAGILVLLCVFPVSSKEKDFLIIDPGKISRYTEDRVAYQRIERTVSPLVDNSIECLMVIKDMKVYYVADGFEIQSDVMNKRILLDGEYQYIANEDFWTDKINGKPDYVRILYRRNDLIVNSNEEFVTTNFGNFYKTVRDKFIKQHADKFRNLLQNRGEAELIVNRKLLSISHPSNNPNDVRQIFAVSASARAADETIYYCEDADGDGITETFTVTRGDGFGWGIKSGPNIMFIYGNTDKDIETMIGKLANESVNGTVNEEKKVIQTFPPEKEIIDMIELITPSDNF